MQNIKFCTFFPQKKDKIGWECMYHYTPNICTDLNYKSSNCNRKPQSMLCFAVCTLRKGAFVLCLHVSVEIYPHKWSEKFSKVKMWRWSQRRELLPPRTQTAPYSSSMWRETAPTEHTWAQGTMWDVGGQGPRPSKLH